MSPRDPYTGEKYLTGTGAKATIGNRADVGIAQMEGMTKTIGKSKVIKGAKAVNGLLRSLGPVGQLISSIPGLQEVLKPLMMIIKPFEPFIKIIAGLLSSFMAGIIKPLFEAFKPFFNLLLSFMPIFAKIGTIIGMIIGMMIKAFMPIIEPLLPLIFMLAKGFGILIILGLLPLMSVVYAVGMGIAFVVDFVMMLLNAVTLGLVARTDHMGSWNKQMLPMMGSIVGSIPEIMSMGTGGYVPGTPGGTLMNVGEGGQGEHVVRGDTIDELSRNQEETNYYLRKLVMLKEDKW